ncbi:MAG TPA: hypothetical protein VHT03_01765 [Rhizomicrobium sp.]|jgi:hypothetical protein|nr:hypothetical protein [Rhizomicrobium sp.]
MGCILAAAGVRGAEVLEERIKQQFPALFITFVSVLIGLVFADLVSEARARMKLWPLNVATLRTWAQVFAMAASAFAAWVVYSHLGISRNRIPTFADSFSAVLVPTPLLIFNSFVGRALVWPWFYFASMYLLICLVTSFWQLRLTRAERELHTFRRLYRPTGFLSVFYAGVPGFAISGWADQHGWLSPLWELAIAATPIPAALLCVHLFLRDWRDAIGVGPARGQ